MSRNSRALVSDRLSAGSTLAFDETPAPAPRAGEVCVEVQATVVDALDALRCRGEDPRSSFPFVPGRVAVGRIAEVAADVAYPAGTMVVVPELLPCGECDACGRARVLLCRRLRALGRGGPKETEGEPIGGLSRFVTVPARYLLPLEAELTEFAKPDRLAVTVAMAWMAPLYQALVMAGVAAGDIAAIVGRGIRVEALRSLLEQKSVQVVEANDVADVDAQAQQRELPRLGWKIFLLEGDRESMQQAARLIGPAATMVVAPQNPLQEVAFCDLGLLAQRDAQIRTATQAHPDLYLETFAMALRGLTPPVLKQFPFAQAQAAIEHAFVHHGAATVVL